MKPSLEALATFAAIVEAGSLSAAARRQAVAKSVVSKRLSELEAVAGAELIRRGRKAAITDAGRAFYQRAKRILAELDAALEECAGGREELKGPIRVAAPLSFSQRFLADVFVAFAQAHPAVTLTVDCDDRRTDLRGGGYDFALRIGNLDDSALIAKKLADVPAVLVASPAYLVRSGRPQRPEDLARHAMIAYGNAAMPQLWRFVGGAKRSRTVTVEPRLVVNSGEIMLDAVRAGLGIAQLPLFIAAPSIRAGELVVLLADRMREIAAVSALWPAKPAPPRRVRALIDLLAAEIPRRLSESGALELQ